MKVIRILIFALGSVCMIVLHVGLIVFTDLTRGEVMAGGSIGSMLYLVLTTSLIAGSRDT